MYPSRNTDARRSVEGEKVLLVKHFVSIELNNPPSPEAAQPGDAPLHLRELHIPKKSQGFPLLLPQLPRGRWQDLNLPMLQE